MNTRAMTHVVIGYVYTCQGYGTSLMMNGRDSDIMNEIRYAESDILREI